MEIRKVLALRGPNIWANFPVIEAWVDLQHWKNLPSNLIPGFNGRLAAWLPAMIEHRCSVGERGGFFTRLRRGTFLAHVLGHVTLELQSMAGVEVAYGRVRATSEEGVHRVVCKYKDEALARACLAAARELVLAVAEDRPFDLTAAVARLRQVAADNLPSPATDAILQAAWDRGIPYRLLDASGLVQLGYGARQRRLRASETDSTPAIAQGIAWDKNLTKKMLQAAGVPTPTGFLVACAADAWETAEEWIGLPVVVKPKGGSGGRAVAVKLHTREEVTAAYETAREESSQVLVEKYVEGDDFRLLLVQGRLISAVRYDPAASSYTDVTGAVHAEVTARAADSARILGLDIAGVDVVARCIDQPLEASQGAVIEVNASPDLRPHLGVDEDDPRGVGAAIVDLLIPAAENGRIPIAAISGTNGKTTVTRFIAHLLRGTFGCVGMTCTDGIYLNDRRIDSDDCSGPISAGMVLTNRSVDAAVCETARGGVLRAGLAFDECTVAVVTNIADGDHLGLNDINTAEDLAKVKRAIVDVVAKDGAAVLNADDPLIVAMAPYSPGRVIYFALDPDHHVIRDHRGRGGQAVFVRDRVVTFADGEREDPWIGLDRLPLTFGGAIAFEIENALAALAAAHAMGVPREALVERAAAFSADMAKVPGRFNVLDVHGATVIVDYGHNAHSLRAIIAALDHFPHQRRSAMYSMAGDRRDSDIVHIGELLGGAFDRIILYEAHTIRGRLPGAIAELLRQGAFRSSRVRLIEEFEGSIGSMEYALDTLSPGDLLLLQADAIDETVDWVRSYLGRLSRGEPLPPLPAPVRVDRLEPHPVTAAPPADAAVPAAVPRGEDEIAMAGGQPSPGMKMRAVAGMRIAPLGDTEANHPQVSPQIVEPREPPIGPRGQSGVSPIPQRLDPFSEEPCTGVLAEVPAGAKEW